LATAADRATMQPGFPGRARERGMKKVSFYSLPRAAQDRLLASFRAELVPNPLLFSPCTRKEAWAWLAVCAGALAALLLLVEIGFGNSQNVLSLHPLPVIVLYAILAATLVVSLLNANAGRARVKALPFAPGLYLFPACLIDAREPVLVVHPLESLTRVAPGPGAHITLTLAGRTFAIPITDATRASEAVQLVESARARLGPELGHHARFELDPLEAPSTASPLGPQTPIARNAPLWERQRWVLGALAGCLLGAGVYQLRNTMSDNKMLALAQARDDVAGYRAYLERGKKHSAMVSEVLLPRAELRVAVSEDSVEAIEAFKREHPHTGIDGEVQLAKRKAMVAAFERARAKNTLADLLAFAAAHPDHGLEEPLRQARHALYLIAKKRVKDSLPPDEDKIAALAGELLSYSERVGAHKSGDKEVGPVVQIRLQRLPTQTLDRSDSAVSKNPMFNGPVSLPSRYFSADKLAPHEKDFLSQLAKRLSEKFDPEMLSFAPGAPLEGTSEDTPKVDAPTLFVTYKIEWSGGVFASRIPRAVLVGSLFFFKAAFALPGDAEPVRNKYTASGSIPHDVLDAHPGVPPAGTIEAEAYAAETKSSFDEFRDKYLAKWFKSGEAKKP
jgi:hypothetical protein